MAEAGAKVCTLVPCSPTSLNLREERKERGGRPGARLGVAHAAEMLTCVGRAEGHGVRAAAAGMLAAPWLMRSPDVTWSARGAVLNYGGSALTTMGVNQQHCWPTGIYHTAGMVYSVFLLTQGSFVDFLFLFLS